MWYLLLFALVDVASANLLAIGSGTNRPVCNTCDDNTQCASGLTCGEPGYNYPTTGDWQADYHWAHNYECNSASNAAQQTAKTVTSRQGCADACRGETWGTNQHAKGFIYRSVEKGGPGCWCESVHSHPHTECGDLGENLDWTRYDFDVPYAFVHYGECTDGDAANQVHGCSGITACGFSIEQCASACKGLNTDNGRDNLGFAYRHDNGDCYCESQASHPHPECTPNDNKSWARYDFVNYSPVFEYQHEGRCQDALVCKVGEICTGIKADLHQNAYEGDSYPSENIGELLIGDQHPMLLIVDGEPSLIFGLKYSWAFKMVRTDMYGNMLQQGYLGSDSNPTTLTIDQLTLALWNSALSKHNLHPTTCESGMYCVQNPQTVKEIEVQQTSTLLTGSTDLEKATQCSRVCTGALIYTTAGVEAAKGFVVGGDSGTQCFCESDSSGDSSECADKVGADYASPTPTYHRAHNSHCPGTGTSASADPKKNSANTQTNGVSSSPGGFDQAIQDANTPSACAVACAGKTWEAPAGTTQEAKGFFFHDNGNANMKWCYCESLHSHPHEECGMTQSIADGVSDWTRYDFDDTFTTRYQVYSHAQDGSCTSADNANEEINVGKYPPDSNCDADDVCGVALCAKKCRGKTWTKGGKEQVAKGFMWYNAPSLVSYGTCYCESVHSAPHPDCAGKVSANDYDRYDFDGLWKRYDFVREGVYETRGFCHPHDGNDYVGSYAAYDGSSADKTQPASAPQEWLDANPGKTKEDLWVENCKVGCIAHTATATHFTFRSSDGYCWCMQTSAGAHFEHPCETGDVLFNIGVKKYTIWNGAAIPDVPGCDHTGVDVRGMGVCISPDAGDEDPGIPTCVNALALLEKDCSYSGAVCPSGKIYFNDECISESDLPCGGGKYASSDGTCTDCQAGRFSTTGGLSCEACPSASGWYQDEVAQSSCKQGSPCENEYAFLEEDCSFSEGTRVCEAGYIFYEDCISESDLPCDPGKYMDAQTMLCTDCQAGRFSTDGTLSCKACPTGVDSNYDHTACADDCSAGCSADCDVGEICPNMWGRMKNSTGFTPLGTLMNPKRLDDDEDGNPVFVIGELNYGVFSMVTFYQNFTVLKSKYIMSTYAHSIDTLTVENYNSHASNGGSSTGFPCDGDTHYCAGDFSCDTLAIGNGTDRPACNTCDNNIQCASGLECKSPDDLTNNTCFWNSNEIPDVPGCKHSGVDWFTTGVSVCVHRDEDTRLLNCTSSIDPLSDPCSYDHVCIAGGGTYKLTMTDAYRDGWHSEHFNVFDGKFVYDVVDDNLNPEEDEGFLYINYGEGLKGFTIQRGLASVDEIFTGRITEMFMYFGNYAEEIRWYLSCADPDSHVVRDDLPGYCPGCYPIEVGGYEADSNLISYHLRRTWTTGDVYLLTNLVPTCTNASTCTSSTCAVGDIYRDGKCFPNCVPGQYSLDGACTACATGKYQDQAYQTSCKACGTNEEANADGTACQCIDGYGGSPCTLCPLNDHKYDWDSGCPAWSTNDGCSCICTGSGFSGDHCDICAEGMGWNGVLGADAKCTACDFPTVNDQTSHNAVCSHDFCPPGQGTTSDQNVWQPDNSTSDNCVDCTVNRVSPDYYGQCTKVICDDYMTVKDTIDHTLNNTNQTNCEPCSGYNVGPSCLPIVCASGRMKIPHDGSGDGERYIDYGLEPNNQDNCDTCGADEVVSADRLTCERVVCPAGFKILVVDPTLSYDDETNCEECTGITYAQGTECIDFDCGSNRVKEVFDRTFAATKCGEQCTGDTILDVNDLTQCVACEGDTVVNSNHTECVTAVCRAGYTVSVTDRSLAPGDYHQDANCEEIDECITASCSPCGELINGYVCTEEIELRQGIEAFANANEHICPSGFRLSSEVPDNAADIGLRNGACPPLKVFAEKLSIHEGVFRSKLVGDTANVVVEDKACKYTYEDLISATYEV